MTDAEVLEATEHDRERGAYTAVHVSGDYEYDGVLVAAGRKFKSGDVRCVVEDEHGRWLVHWPDQLRKILVIA